MPIRLHIDDPELLRHAIDFTAQQTGFNPRLIEKDYFCSVVLEYIAANGANLIFKGGTCLSKIHGDFYRLSEDLDFSISTPIGSSRTERSRRTVQLKKSIAALSDQLPGFRIIEPLKGANNSTQYNAVLSYVSLIDDHIEPISVEVGVREPILTRVEMGSARTALLNPITGRALVGAVDISCLSYAEAMAEKFRAALCRSEVAIRDFFDVAYATRRGFDPHEPAFRDLLREKIAIPGTNQINITDIRMTELRRQLDAQLRPMLRHDEYRDFDLEQAIAIVCQVAHGVGPG